MGNVEVSLDEAAYEAELEEQRRSGAEPPAEHHVGGDLEREEHGAQGGHGAPVRDSGHAHGLEQGGGVPKFTVDLGSGTVEPTTSVAVHGHHQALDPVPQVAEVHAQPDDGRYLVFVVAQPERRE